MKKSTLIVLVLAVGLGAWAYYSEIRHPQPPAADESAPKNLFHFDSLDVASVRLERPDGNVELERRENDWVVTQPLATHADKRAADSLASALAMATSSRTLAAGPERWKEYGLDSPALTVAIRAKKGEQHRLRFGGKDFSGDSVYAVLDDGAQSGGKMSSAKEILLVSALLLSSATKSLNDLRDRALLAFSSWDLTAVEIRRASGDFRLEKQGRYWNMLSPRKSPADDSEMSTLSGAFSSAEFADVTAETTKDFAHYGLTSPAITVHLKTEKGEEGTLLVGKKENDKYYARDSARSMVFRLEPSFVDKLDVSFDKLRDRHVLRVEQTEITHVLVNNGTVTMAAAKDANGKWTVEEPADRKGKEFQFFKVYDPVSSLRATGFLDKPDKAILAKLEKPQVEVELKDQAGKLLKLVVSAPDGDNIYARSNQGRTVYKADKFFLTDIKFTAAEAAP
jgi:hypothetical protein